MKWSLRKRDKHALTPDERTEVDKFKAWVNDMQDMPEGPGLGKNPYVELLKASKVR